MAKKRVIAHFMHEFEEAAAQHVMPQAERTESYLLGEIDEDAIPGLRQQGLVVQVIDEPPDLEAAGAGADSPMGFATLGGPGGPSIAAAPALDAAGPNFYYVRVRGPLLDAWRGALGKLDVALLEQVRRHTYTARLTPAQAMAIRALPFVSGVRVYGPEDSARPVAPRMAAFRPPERAVEPPPAPGPAPSPGRRMLTFDVRLHRAEDREQVMGRLRDRGVALAGASGRKVRVYLLDDARLAEEIRAIREIPEVAYVEEYVPPRLHNDVARCLLGIDPAAPQPGGGLAESGAGQIVAVADTGLDDSHPDFQGRIQARVALGRPGDTSDPHGHGTHVAGSVLGDGAASGGRIRGAAPGARLFFQSLLDADGGLGGLPLDLNDLFEQAYRAGARIHNNSWGAFVGSEYTLNSREVDEFVASHRDMLIVISAGNDGQASQRRHSKPGFVDWLSIGSPASCKNALTVGASRSSRTAGGYATLTHDQTWPAQFPDPPIGAATISGDPDCLAGFSSRGPCTDRRIKPDVVAPGTDIASARSSAAPQRRFWGSVPGQARYAFMGGTSMAAPLVAGCAALVREYYVKTRGHQPSAALLKATLINGARQLTGPDAVADHATLPNFHQGFGCVSMASTIPNPSAPKLRIEFLDPWQAPGQQLVRNGQRVRVTVTVAGGPWLRIGLAWTDLPARGLQNNLNLFVQHLPPGGPPGQKWMGNESLPASLGIPDPDNNVEVVRLPNPAPGEYLIQITASNLLQPGQDFALVVIGELGSALAPM